MTRNKPHLLILSLYALMWVVLIMLVTSCRTQDHFTDATKMVYSNRVDSVYILQHDSVFVDRYVKGDTVFLTRDNYHVKYQDKIVLVHDTTFQTRTETQTIIQKKVPPWCWWLLGIVVLIVSIFITAFILRLKGR